MKNPFVYGEEVTGEAFWNRGNEIKELTQDIKNGQNVIIFSTRRYGKTSLIKNALEKVRREGVLTVYGDLSRPYAFSPHRLRGFLKFKIVLAFRAFFGKIHPSMGPG